MNILLQSLYFILPAYMANAAPLLFKWIPYGAAPLDGGKKFRGKRIFGDHKTYRGLVSGILLGTAVAVVQWYLVGWKPFNSLSPIPYDRYELSTAIAVGLAFGAGAMIGDCIKSFFKQQLDKEAGSSWVPFDQLDFVVGALIMVSFFYLPSLSHIIVILTVTPLLHLVSNIIAYLLKLKNVWW